MMSSDPYKIPTFSKPEKELTFLTSEKGNFTYGNLYGFTNWLAEKTSEIHFSEEKPLLICGPSSDEIIFLIAACFLLKIPFLSLHEEFSDSDAKVLKSQIDPHVIFTDEPDRFKTVFDAQRIKIGEEQLTLQGE